MSSSPEPWRALWAKTKRGTDQWHALPCHLLDVGATAERLWDSLPRSAKKVPLALHDSEEVCRKIVVFLAAAHDVGKANPFFQFKDARRAAAMGLKDPGPETCGHGYATGVFLKDWLVECWDWDDSTAVEVASAVGGHHGSFFQNMDPTPLEIQKDPWKSIGPRLLDELAAVLGLPKRIDTPKNTNPLLGWLAGFVCVADWLGSHDGMTIFREEAGDLRTYLEESRANAATLFHDLRWPFPVATPMRPVEALVPEGREPNSVQRLAERVASGGFGLAVVEAPTGEGKTEAAFALAEPLRAEGAGACFLLPTMATANGLYERVKGYLKSDVRLAHSQAWLYRDEGIVADGGMAAEAEDWFAGSKRALLWSYGVGTVDQGLMGALRVRHGFVRLFALAGKTVVVDEVHAYDVYMSDLLEVLLGWLRALGCRVVLLSATLPAARRAALFRAWGFEVPEAASYPCMTWTDADGAAHSETFGVAPRKPLELRLLERGEGEAWEQGAARILERVTEGGGTGALVLNTVGGAQSAYAWLKVTTEGTGIGVTLFHARYTAQDRSRKEKKTLKRFGKTGKRRRPTILVATQVVEQSLDLDFDHMVSSLAPIDLLIQRAGRLHRHRRHIDGSLCEGDEPDERADPVLDVLSPKERDGASVFDDPVYARDVLVRTLDVLEKGVRVEAPKDVATHVEAVYGDLDPEESREAWLAHYAEASDKEELKRERMSDYAKRVVVPRAYGRVPLTDKKAITVEDDSPESDVAAKTRLEDLPSVTLALLRKGDSDPDKVPNAKAKEAIALRCVRVSAGGKRYAELVGLPPAKGWRKVKALREARPFPLNENGRFETSSYVYHYDVEVGLKWEARDA